MKGWNPVPGKLVESRGAQLDTDRVWGHWCLRLTRVDMGKRKEFVSWGFQGVE